MLVMAISISVPARPNATMHFSVHSPVRVKALGSSRQADRRCASVFGPSQRQPYVRRLATPLGSTRKERHVTVSAADAAAGAMLR